MKRGDEGRRGREEKGGKRREGEGEKEERANTMIWFHSTTITIGCSYS